VQAAEVHVGGARRGFVEVVYRELGATGGREGA
jgi:hypothetical protein